MLIIGAIALVAAATGVIMRWRKPKPPKNEAVTLTIVTGPIIEQTDSGPTNRKGDSVQ